MSQRPPSPRILAAVLFTDIVHSTSVAEELGDRRWKTLLDRHHEIVRRELRRFSGRELDTAGDGFRGRIVLVRNPSWDPAADPNRRAFADRIEIAVGPSSASLYRNLEAGTVDVVMGEDPPVGMASRYRSSASLQDRIVTATGAGTFVVIINVAQPPFEDPHVRRALAQALDRDALGRVDPLESWLRGHDRHAPGA